MDVTVTEHVLRRAERQNMLVLLGTTLMVAGSRMLWYQLVPLYLRDLGASDAAIGVVFTVTLLLGPMQLAGGMVSDRWGRRFAITVPSLLLAPVLIGGALAQHWKLLAVTVWLVALLADVQRPGFQALLAESASDDTRGRAFGLFYTVTGLTTMLGPAVGAFLLERNVRISQLIWVSAVGALVAGILRLGLLREGRFRDVSVEAENIQFRAILREPLFQRLIFVNGLFLLLLSLTQEGPFVALHAADGLGLSKRGVNLLFAVGGIGAVLAALIGGSLADRFGGRRSGAVGLCLHVVVLIGWAVVAVVPWQGYVIFAASWVSLQIGVVAYATWYSAFAPSAVRGRVLGLIGAFASVVGAIGPQLAIGLRTAALSVLSAGIRQGSVKYRLASSTPFSIALVTVLLLALLLSRMPGRHEIGDLVQND